MQTSLPKINGIVLLQMNKICPSSYFWCIIAAEGIPNKGIRKKEEIVLVAYSKDRSGLRLAASFSTRTADWVALADYISAIGPAISIIPFRFEEDRHQNRMFRKMQSVNAKFIKITDCG